MRGTLRATLGALAVALGSLAMAGSAGAAAGQTTHYRFHGDFAEAEWFSQTATTFADTYFNASRTHQGRELFIDRFSGTATGEAETTVDATVGFSFAMDARKLSSASVSGTGLPGVHCTYDLDFNLIGCSRVHVSFTATVTGRGPIARGTSNDHFKIDGFSENDHFNGTNRDASAAGALAGIPLTAGALEYSDLGHANSGTVVICRGLAC